MVFLMAFLLFLLLFIGMSLGYIIKRRALQGSCGGIGALGLEKVCDCPEPCDARQKRLAKAQARADALKRNRIL